MRAMGTSTVDAAYWERRALNAEAQRNELLAVLEDAQTIIELRWGKEGTPASLVCQIRAAIANAESRG